MSLLNEFLQRVSRARVDALPVRNAADLDMTTATEGLEVIQRLTKEELTELLEAGARSGMNREVLTVLRSFHEIAVRHGDSLKAGSYVGNDLITRGGKTLRGQLLQRHLKTWRGSLGPGADKSAVAFLQGMEPFAKMDLALVPHGKRRLITLLKALLGTTFDLVSKATVRPKVDARPILSVLRLIHPDRAETALEIAEDLVGIAKAGPVGDVSKHVNDAFGRIYKLVDDFPDQAGELAEVVDEFNDPRNVQAIVDLTTELLKKYSPDRTLSGLSEGDLVKLIGKSKNSTDHLFDEIVLAQMMVFRRLKDIENYSDMGMSSADLFRAFMNVPGSEGFFETILSRRPHEHAYIFEQLVSFNLIAALIREFGDAAGRIAIKAWIGSKEGPDNIVIILKDENGQITKIARIIQAKSYQSLAGIIRLVRSGTDLANPAAFGDVSGDIVKQSWGDLRRTMGSGGRFEDRATGGIMDIDMFDGVLRSKIDLERARRHVANFDESALKAALESDNILVDAVDGAVVARLDLKDLVASSDPKIITALKQHLKANYIDPMIDAIKVEIGTIPALLAEEVKKLNLADFQAAYAFPAPKGDWGDRYNRMIDLFTQKEVAGLTDEARAVLETRIRDEFLGYFHTMFDCPNGTLEIEFDVVDLLTDVNVARGKIWKAD